MNQSSYFSAMLAKGCVCHYIILNRHLMSSGSCIYLLQAKSGPETSANTENNETQAKCWGTSSSRAHDRGSANSIIFTLFSSKRAPRHLSYSIFIHFDRVDTAFNLIWICQKIMIKGRSHGKIRAGGRGKWSSEQLGVNAKQRS